MNRRQELDVANPIGSRELTSDTGKAFSPWKHRRPGSAGGPPASNATPLRPSRGDLAHRHARTLQAGSLPAPILACLWSELQKAPEICRKTMHRERIEASPDTGSSASLLARSCCARIVIETWHPLDGRR